MAVTFMAGFEARQATADGITLSGTSAYSTAQARTGAASIRCNPSSNNTGYVNITAGSYTHFGLYVATLPSLDRDLFTPAAAGAIVLKLTSTGTIKVLLNTTPIGTSSAAFASPGWHWIGVRQVTGTSVVFLQIDGLDEVTGTATVSVLSTFVGLTANTEASAVDVYIDDIVVDGAGLLAPSKVGLLIPTADNARGTGWVGGAGGTTSLFAGVDNTPPVGVADTGTDTSQIRNATSAASSNMDMTMTTYTAAGVGAGDTVLAVQNVIATAAPVTTSAKQGLVGNVSNPAITTVALGAGGTAGAFWSGVAGGTYPTGWKVSFGTFTTSPSVTVGTAPVMRVTQVTSSTRIAMVCFMGMVVAWTPGAAATQVPYTNRMPSLLAQ
jgi:hypothetical protein